MTERQGKAFSVQTVATTVIVVMLVSLILVLGLWLKTSYEATRMRTEERVTAAAQVVGLNSAWISVLARQTLQRIDDRLGDTIGATRDADRVADIRKTVTDLPVEIKAYVVNRFGRTVYSTDSDIKPVSITDRDYFRAVADGAPDYVSSLLVSRLNGDQIFVFSRRLERDGQFAGAAMASFSADILRPIWLSLNLGDNSTVSIVRDDGMLVARYPKPDGPVDLSQHVLFTEHLKKAKVGTYASVSPVDGSHRLVGYRVMEGTRFVALASIDDAKAIAGFRDEVVVAIAILAIAGAAALAAAAWIRHLLSVDAQRAERLSATLEENKLLLREIHHRVKNNLQSVQSLIRLQRMPAEAQTSLGNRIAAMVSVHELIYRHDQFKEISARALVTALIASLIESYDRKVHVTYEIEDIAVPTDVATPLALLINELVTNSIKYAFPPGMTGTIQIVLASIGPNRLRLTVADDGIGREAQPGPPGMGSRLIAGVISQLRGAQEYRPGKGTCFVAEFDIG